MLVSLWEAPTWLTETTRNICYQFCNESVNLSLEELTQSKDCPQNKLLFLTYMTNSSLGRHMNAVRNSSVLYHKRGPGRGWWWWWWWWWGGGGGGPMSSVWILKRLVSVFINACRLLSGLLSLSQFGRGRLSLVAISFCTLSLLFGPWHLSEFILAGPHITKKPFAVKICKNRSF